jgi:hypothetical protein
VIKPCCVASGRLLTPISGPVSSEQSTSPAAPVAVSQCSECRSQPLPFLHLLAATERARHPSGSSERQILLAPFALAAMPPRKNFGAVMRPWGSHNRVGCRVVGANPRLARIPGDPLYCISGTTTRHPIQSRWLFASQQSGLAGRRRNSYAKQRVISNGLCSFSI